MAYQSGTVSSADNLLGTLAAFAVTNGWTQNMYQADGDGYRLHLNNGDCFANLRSSLLVGPDGDETDPGVWVRASTGYNGTSAWDAQPGDSGAFAYVGKTYTALGRNGTTLGLSWPMNYHAFSLTLPDVIVFVIEFQPGMFQWIMLGEVIKYGTWTGGGFSSASCAYAWANLGFSGKHNTFSIGGASITRSYAPFYEQAGGYYNESGNYNTNSMLHAEVDGQIWLKSGTYINGGVPDTKIVHANTYSSPLNSRSPNVFNALGVMTPFWLFTQNSSDWTILGVLEHVRQLPIDNFSPGDIFTLGSNKWMVFPYFTKYGYTGRYGWAIRYDGI